METAKVIASGNSAVVVLPKKFREANDVHVGDSIEIDFPAQGVMTLRVPGNRSSDRVDSFRKLTRLIADSGGDDRASVQSREDLRDELERRYA